MSGNCVLCGVWRRALHRDHIYPKWRAKRDGWDKIAIEDPSNLRYICANCHEDKTHEDSWNNTPEAAAQRNAVLAKLHNGREYKENHAKRLASLEHQTQFARAQAKSAAAPRTEKQLANAARVGTANKNISHAQRAQRKLECARQGLANALAAAKEID